MQLRRTLPTSAQGTLTLEKLKIPRFFSNARHRQHLLLRLKLFACPGCGVESCLIRNGLLYGNDPAQNACARIERAQRFRCSNRNRRQGCGKSFCIHLPSILPNRSIDSAFLSAFLKALLQCKGRIHAAWQQISCHPFSLSTAYRIYRELDASQCALRERLFRCTGPPQSIATQPRLQLLAHLFHAFTDSDPIQAFQLHFQCPWLPRFQKHPTPTATMQ